MIGYVWQQLKYDDGGKKIEDIRTGGLLTWRRRACKQFSRGPSRAPQVSPARFSDSKKRENEKRKKKKQRERWV